MTMPTGNSLDVLLYNTAAESLIETKDTSYFSSMEQNISSSHDSGINSPTNEQLKNESEILSGILTVVNGSDNDKEEFTSNGYLACSSQDVVDNLSSEHGAGVSKQDNVTPSSQVIDSSLPNENKTSLSSTNTIFQETDNSSNPFIILSSSRIITENSSRKTSRSSVDPTSPQEDDKVDKNFIKQLIHDAYEQDDNTYNDEQPSLEYDDEWDPCAQSSPSRHHKVLTSPSRHHKILIRELSFDELKDVQGIDLMAPVFLAVTDEPDESFKDLRRKAKSIEDLCSTAYLENDYDTQLRNRSKSELPLRYQSRRILKSSNDTNFHELTYEDEFDDADIEEIKLRLTSLTMSNISDDFSRLDSITSDQYNESIDDDLEDQALIDVFVNHGMYDSLENNESSFDMLHDISDSMITNDESLLKSTPDIIAKDEEENIANEQKRPTSLKLFNETGDTKCTGDLSNQNMTSLSGFWEYPSSPSPTSTQTPIKSKNLSINTSPKSSSRPCSPKDRFIIVNVAGQQRVVDMKLIEPYLKILSHGGHHSTNSERCVLVVFSACYLPQKSIEKYKIVMEQLFYYFVHAVDLLVVDTYEIVFFNSPTDNNMPSRAWIKQCYNMINYRLKKNLRRIFFVHQSLWLKTVLQFSQLFVSSKFRRKIRLVRNIQNLKKHIPLEYIFIPPEIYKNDKRFS